jgi:hypothetical protein
MNDTDVSKQILQMVRFIHQEAEEKAGEISVSAEEVSFSPSVPLPSLTPDLEASRVCLLDCEPLDCLSLISILGSRDPSRSDETP